MSEKIKITRGIFGPHYVFVVADAYSTMLEQDENNNSGHSEAITIPRMSPDLAVQMLAILSGSYVYAGESVKVVWRVKNDGSGSTLDDSWRDMLYLSKTSSLGSNTIKIYEGTVRPRVLPGHVYNYTAMVSIPENTYGEYFLIVKVNGDNSLKETDLNTNNIASTRITLRKMPQPDLKILSATFQYEPLGNLLEIHWRVKNFGNSMTKTNVWIDKILLSPTTSKINGYGVHPLGSKEITARLLSQQEYSASATFAVSPSISGPMYVHVSVNYQGKLQASSRDHDNIRHTAIPISIKGPPLPIIKVQIET
jgi:subtilase family serine protease